MARSSSAETGADDHLDDLRRRIGDLTGVPADHVTLFWKGRVALYAILRALRIGPGDEVIVPAFTCVAVPNAILYAGATPVYVDIDERTYTPDPMVVEAAVGPRTRAILAQNTFGLSSDLKALSVVAADAGAVVIDDCAHGLGGAYQGQPSGAAADAAFYSTQWTKPLSTGLGGIAVTRHEDLAGQLRAIESAAREPARHETTILRALLLARDRVARSRTLSAGRTVYRASGRLGIVPGSSSREELSGRSMPNGFLTRMSGMQAGLAARRIEALPDIVVRRRAVAARYSALLRAHGRTAAHEPSYAVHSFLRYPIRVHEPHLFADLASRRGIDIGDWFRSPVHPATGDLSAWGYRWGTNPVAERVASEIANLPTDLDPESKQIEAVEDFVTSSMNRIR
jgi:dTDP-4-amino-4,6-dideoxygalactose transaminase